MQVSDGCHDALHANLRLGFRAPGLWGLGPLALGSLALGLLARLWLQVPAHHVFECLWATGLGSL